ncbi:putative necrosis-inducing factor-domain-containing protein [Jackrogersella minutella]|nr:putative necrosis-inducing factor-domain-containing protein [Jackrogersella minutella]
MMHSVGYITTIILGISILVAAIPLPSLDGTFIERQVQHPNGSTVNVYIKNGYKSSHGGLVSLNKRFYETYHNDTSKYEICAETNFVDTSTLDSALSSDCSAIITELKTNPGFFETGGYTGNEYNYLAVCGTCAFGVHRTDGLSSRVDIGSADVIDNINVAIIRFPVDDHVGATGNFTCNSAPINWAILRAT